MRKQHPVEQFLKERKMSRREFALKLGITEAMMSYCLNHKRRFGIEKAMKISRITGLTLEQIYKESK